MAHGAGFLAYVVAVGFVSCLFSGIVGVGAVMLIAPLLYFGAPLFFHITMDFREISNLTTIAVVIAAVRAIFIYRGYGLIRREIIGPMGIPAFIFAAGGTYLASIANPWWIQVVFAVSSLTGAAFLLIPYHRALDDTARTIEAKPVAFASVAGLIGFIGGFAGAGGGFLLIPTLMGVFRMPTRVALGTAAFTGLIIALVAFVGRIALVHIDWYLVAAIAAGAYVGAGIGTHYQQRVPTLILRRAVIGVIVIAAGRLLISSGS